jgi:hypothetical protein
MMTTNIPNALVNAVAEGRTPANPEAKLAALNRELEKVKRDIAEQERLENRYMLYQSAYDKLRRELTKTLTLEERDAIDGAYIFLHSGSVDIVRNIPSATSKGEDVKLEKDLSMAEAMKELDSIQD